MEISITNCQNPDKCRKCIQICPAKIFVLKPTGTKRLCNYVKMWKISTIFKDLCNGCMKCVEVCPEDCIKGEF